MPPTKPRSLIPDTDIVIYLHEIGLWEALCQAVEVVIPSIVVREARHYRGALTGEPVRIDLKRQVCARKVIELAADASDIAALLAHCRKPLIEGLHDGEREALALLFSGKAEGCVLCTGDQAAVRALVAFDMRAKGTSLESALKAVGLGRHVSDNFSEARYQLYVKRASIDRISGLL